MLGQVSHDFTRNERPATDSVAGYPNDVLIVPSRTSDGLVHRVRLDVFTNQPASCSCEAGQRGEVCWAMQQIAEEECSYILQRCVECGALCRLGRFYTRSGEWVTVLVCSADSQHSGHEPASAALPRTEVC